MKRIVIWNGLNLVKEMTDGQNIVEVPSDFSFAESVECLAARGYTGDWRYIDN